MEDTTGSDGDIKKLFTSILGSDVTIKDNIDSTEESVFVTFIKKIEESRMLEEKIVDDWGIDLTRIIDPLWYVIEHTFNFLYGKDATDLIMWYIYDRFDPDGKVIDLEDEDGKKFNLKTPNDLWSYIKYRFPPKSQ